MTFFANPQYLWLLAIPVCLAFWEWVRKGHAIVLPIDHQHHKKGIFLAIAIHTANMLPAMMMASAILLLARPMTQAPPDVVRKAKNIQIVLDLSGSMNYAYGPQNANTETPFRRIDAAMNAIENFVGYRDGDSFGLTVYGKAFIHWVPLTPDTNAIVQVPNDLEETRQPRVDVINAKHHRGVVLRAELHVSPEGATTSIDRRRPPPAIWHGVKPRRQVRHRRKSSPRWSRRQTTVRADRSLTPTTA